jgi:hypothetical protein
MGFLDKLRTHLLGRPRVGASSSPGGDPDALWLHFRCNKCGSTVRVRAHRRNDVNQVDEGPGDYMLRKEVMDNKCFQLIRADVYLDASRRIVTAHVEGGELITAEEYQALQQTTD